MLRVAGVFLPRRHVNITALRVGQGVELGGVGGVVMHLDVVHGHAGQRFNPGFQRIRQTRVIDCG